MSDENAVRGVSARVLAEFLERTAPLAAAEEWDNVGLLMGDPLAEIERVMTCLTVSETTAREAIEGGFGFVVSHHPILFRPTKRLRADDPETGHLWRLARAGVGVYSAHTAFDNARGGMNDVLAEKLGLVEIRSLRTGRGVPELKIVVFTPEADREAVLSAAFRAGAGRIGEYRECSFAASGTGTFFGSEASNPAVGGKGRRESVAELRLETICPVSKLDQVIRAIREAHSYEEPAIDVHPLRAVPSEPGVGRIGRLTNPCKLKAFAEIVGRTLNARGVRFAGDPEAHVERVAIMCGAGDDFLADAKRAGADVLLTGEARFHRAFEAERLGIGLVTAGHHETEWPGVVALADRIRAEFPGLEVRASEREIDPMREA